MENPVVVKTSQVKKGGVWFSIRHFCTGAAVAAFVGLGNITTGVHAAEGQAQPAPQAMCNGLATGQAWTLGIAVVGIVIALILIGLGIAFSHYREDGSTIFKKLGLWGLGAVIVGAAPEIARVFVSAVLQCQ
ncbi:hypothetical protein [Rothia dentocariosa]|mgnify:FL=1|uniref:hypothetical protein n=1 Tax=Rothia dentocariosa TaxID=2047 RepID=UPI0001E06B81|nr:hypothetical protein [Rothia dentocariosa]EFJ78188.1 Gram-positive signal peptide protein, YSIRK family [Rothia dentocariosa M567]QKI10031.1 hypothetical protein FOC60_09390 [Rothia dentocariosa]